MLKWDYKQFDRNHFDFFGVVPHALNIVQQKLGELGISNILIV